MALNSRSRYIHILINDAKNGAKTLEGFSKEQLIHWLNVNTDFYAYIYHDLDTKIDNTGLLVQKIPHTHIVALLKQNGSVNKKGQKQYKRFSTILNELEDATHISQERMTISVAKDWIGNCRYLLHLDSKEKFAYDRSKVVTSDDEMYNNFIIQESNVLSVDKIYAILEECDYSLRLVMQEMGLDNYKKYRLVIRDIVQSQYKELQR